MFPIFRLSSLLTSFQPSCHCAQLSEIALTSVTNHVYTASEQSSHFMRPVTVIILLFLVYFHFSSSSSQYIFGIFLPYWLFFLRFHHQFSLLSHSFSAFDVCSWASSLLQLLTMQSHPISCL